jgi:hypothetical protein
MLMFIQVEFGLKYMRVQTFVVRKLSNLHAFAKL